MHSKFLARRFVATGLLTAFFSCSGPMLDVPKNQEVKKIETPSSDVPKVQVNCGRVVVDGGKVFLEVSEANVPLYHTEDKVLSDLSHLWLDPKAPLDYFCNNRNELIWLSADSIDFLKINPFSGRFGVSQEPILGISYKDVIEYKLDGARVIAGAILKDPSFPWDKIPIATITNTGVLQVGTYSMNTFYTGEHDRFLYDLKSSQVIPEEQRWPKEGVERAVVSIIDPKNICVIPLGDSWQSVKYFYLVHYTGNSYKELSDVIVLTMIPQSRAPGLRNIISATSPKYNPAEGKGLHVLLEYETTGGASSIIAVLLPDVNEVFKD